MADLYPEIEPYKTHNLPVSDIHNLYIEECGNPDGKPILFVRGGPGGEYMPNDRRFFDPEYYRIILFDQRGAGKSVPRVELEENTTQDLVYDMEKIREYLEIDKWAIFGGSWGSTLGLVYAEAYPTRVSAMVLRGIFLGSPRGWEWLYGETGANISPEGWEDFVSFIPEDERGDIVGAYHRRIIGTDGPVRNEAIKRWARWEGIRSFLIPDPQILEVFDDPETSRAFSTICAHYMVNKCFLEPNQILRNSGKLRGIPGVIIHGRYDLLCPVRDAYELHKAWPESELKITPDAGHAASEHGTLASLLEATDSLKSKL